MSYVELVSKDRRSRILQALEQQPDYAANEALLQMLLESIGHGVSQDTIQGDIIWLKEQGFVMVNEIASLLVATITPRGVDIAKGRATHPGIKRPGP